MRNNYFVDTAVVVVIMFFAFRFRFSVVEEKISQWYEDDGK